MSEHRNGGVPQLLTNAVLLNFGVYSGKVVHEGEEIWHWELVLFAHLDKFLSYMSDVRLWIPKHTNSCHWLASSNRHHLDAFNQIVLVEKPLNIPVLHKAVVVVVDEIFFVGYDFDASLVVNSGNVPSFHPFLLPTRIRRVAHEGASIVNSNKKQAQLSGLHLTVSIQWLQMSLVSCNRSADHSCEVRGRISHDGYRTGFSKHVPYRNDLHVVGLLLYTAQSLLRDPITE